MKHRREFLRGLACTAALSTCRGGPLWPPLAWHSRTSPNGGVASEGHPYNLSTPHDLPTVRPAPSQRRFVSRAVEAKIAEVKSAITNPELAWLFENCFPNTLDTTVAFGVRDNRPDTLVVTGDINAMWLRDSTAQVTPYVPFAREDNKLKDLIAGVINRQTICILIDRYAN